MRIVLLAVAIATGTFSSASVAAGALPGDEADDSSAVLQEGPATEAEAYATESGVSVEEAKNRLGRQQDLHLAFEKAEESIGDDRLAGIWIEHNSTGVQGFVAVKGHELIDADTERLLRNTGIGINYGAAFARTELIQAANLAGRDESVVGVAVDEPANGIRVTLAPGSNPNAQVSSVPVDVPYVVIVADELPENWFAMHGGQGMFLVSNDQKICTSGFNVRKPPYLPGILTAGHCHDNLKQNGATLGFFAQVYNYNVDAQWHIIPTPHTAEGKYRCGAGQVFCAVTGSGNPASGAYVCHFGSFSGFSCGNVTALFAAPFLCGSNGQQLCNANFIEVHGSSLKGCPGDSGGPLHRSGTAHGVLKGGGPGVSCTAVGKTVYYSRIAPIESGLGVTIMKG